MTTKIETKLREIHSRAVTANLEGDLGVFSSKVTPIIEQDVPRLVQALRRAADGFNQSHELHESDNSCHREDDPDDACPACIALADIEAILEGTK